MTRTAIERVSYGRDWLLPRSTEMLSGRTASNWAVRFQIHRTPSIEIRATQGQALVWPGMQSAVLEVILQGEL